MHRAVNHCHFPSAMAEFKLIGPSGFHLPYAVDIASLKAAVEEGVFWDGAFSVSNHGMYSIPSWQLEYQGSGMTEKEVLTIRGQPPEWTFVLKFNINPEGEVCFTCDDTTRIVKCISAFCMAIQKVPVQRPLTETFNAIRQKRNEIFGKGLHETLKLYRINPAYVPRAFR